MPSRLSAIFNRVSDRNNNRKERTTMKCNDMSAVQGRRNMTEWLRTTLAMVLGFLAVSIAHAGTITWDGSDSTAWNTGDNWVLGSAPSDGDDLVFTQGNPTYQPSNNDISNLKLRTLTFANSTFTGPLALGGNAIELDTSYGAATTLTNANTTAGREVTIGNNIVVTGNQQWSTPNANGVTILSGNLSGSGDITINSHDATLTLPALRLNGTNSSYTGNIILPGGQKYGIMLMKPSAMIGGSIRADNSAGGTRPSVWVNAAAGTGTYTFGIGTGAGEVALRQPSGTGTANTDGLHVTGGNMSWDPGNGNDYALPTTNPRISLGGQLASEPTPYRVDFGTAGKRLILQSATGFQIGHSLPGTILNIQFALSDDGTARPVLVGDHAANTYSLGGLVVLNSAATGGNLGGTTTIKSGALAVSDMNQLFNGNLNLSKDSGPNLHGGALVLDNVSWADFLADRSGGYGTGANQWQLTGGGFAARGTPLTIGTTGTDATTFDRNFVLGAQFKGTDGTFYANAPVTLAQNTTLTAQRTITAYATGPGLTGGTADGVELRISGNLSGPGSLYLAGNIDGERISEIVLAGANSWDGAPSVGQSIGGTPGSFFNLGPGGLAVGGALQVGHSVFARFASPASLPTGGSGTRWLGAVARQTTDLAYGFLFTGDADGVVYDLNADVPRQVVIGASRDTQSGTVGATGGKVILRDADLVILGSAVSSAPNLGLLARPEAELILGDGSGAARMIPAYATWTAAASATQDTLYDRTGISTLVKRGEGTVVLGNVAYTKLDGTPLATSQFAWQMGRGISGNSGATAYFDGAVRGLSFNDPAANASNSLAAFNIQFKGAVYEIDNSGGGSGTFTAAIHSSNPGSLWWPSGSASGGGGFSAYGGPVTVTLTNAAGTPNGTLTWAGNDIVRGTGDALLLGSRTANAALTWTNPINLNGAVREIRVYDNPNSTGDQAVLSGILSGTGSSGITKAGDGVLVLSGPNTYAGATTVTAGTLLVNNTTGSGTGAGNVTVSSGAAIGGNGIISGTLTLENGAKFYFDPSYDGLTISGGTVNLGDLGIDDILNLDSSVADNTYTLLAGTFSITGGNNWGLANAYDLGDKKFAYFETGSLNLVVLTIPEPASALLLVLAGLVALRRRRG